MQVFPSINEAACHSVKQSSISCFPQAHSLRIIKLCQAPTRVTVAFLWQGSTAAANPLTLPSLPQQTENTFDPTSPAASCSCGRFARRCRCRRHFRHRCRRHFCHRSNLPPPPCTTAGCHQRCAAAAPDNAAATALHCNCCCAANAALPHCN